VRSEWRVLGRVALRPDRDKSQCSKWRVPRCVTVQQDKSPGLVLANSDNSGNSDDSEDSDDRDDRDNSDSDSSDYSDGSDSRDSEFHAVTTVDTVATVTAVNSGSCRYSDCSDSNQY
jgi:hypothetical protein